MGGSDSFDADAEVLLLLQAYETTRALPKRHKSLATTTPNADPTFANATSYEDAFAAFQEQLERNTILFGEEVAREDGLAAMRIGFDALSDEPHRAPSTNQLLLTPSAAVLDNQGNTSEARNPALSPHAKSHDCKSCSNHKQEWASGALAAALADFQERQQAYAAQQAAAEGARAALQQRLAEESAALAAQLEAQRRSSEELLIRAARRTIAAGYSSLCLLDLHDNL